MRSPILLPIRMNAAETSASSAIAPWTPLTVVSRSSTTAAIDTFISDVSTTRTNIAIASSTAQRVFTIADAAATGVSPPHLKRVSTTPSADDAQLPVAVVQPSAAVLGDDDDVLDAHA